MPTFAHLALATPRTPLNVAFQKVLDNIRSAQTEAQLKTCDRMLLNLHALFYAKTAKPELEQSTNYLLNALLQKRVWLLCYEPIYA